MTKLFVTDIDGTLCDGETVPSDVCKAFEKLRNAGWTVLIATGRPFASSREHVKAIGVNGPSMFFNGCLIADPKGHAIHTNAMDINLAENVLRRMWQFHSAEVHVMQFIQDEKGGHEHFICHPGDVETLAFFSPVMSHSLLTKPVLTTNLKGTGQGKALTLTLGVWGDPWDIPNFVKTLSAEFGDSIEVCASGAECLDVTAPNVSKGSGLRWIIEHLIEQPEIVVAAGDQPNDLTLLQSADIAAAPSNAVPEILKVANFMYPPARESGVCELIHHLLTL